MPAGAPAACVQVLRGGLFTGKGTEGGACRGCLLAMAPAGTAARGKGKTHSTLDLRDMFQSCIISKAAGLAVTPRGSQFNHKTCLGDKGQACAHLKHLLAATEVTAASVGWELLKRHRGGLLPPPAERRASCVMQAEVDGTRPDAREAVCIHGRCILGTLDVATSLSI